MIRIAVAQVNPTVGDLSGNKTKMIGYIRQAKEKKADLVVFPELAVCGYPPEDLLHKDHFIRDNIKTVRSLCQEAGSVTVVAGFVDRDPQNRLYNAAAVMSGKTIKGIYRKEELPNYGVFDEKRYFERGTRNKIFSLGGQLFGVSICEDIWLDGGSWRRQAGEGASLLVNISCSPYDVGKLKQREQLLKQRAIHAGAYVCYANLVGGQDELVFDGGSVIFSPQGKRIASARQFEEDMMVVDLDIRHSRRKPRRRGVIFLGESPAREQRGMETAHISPRLSQIERIYSALVLGTRDYVLKNGFRKVVLGISGGIDSALVAAIAVDALGSENVIGVTMPSRFTSEGTRTDAQRLAENLKIELIDLPIGKIFDVYLRELAESAKGTAFGLAEENLQARIRGNILMTLSNKFGWLVLTTGNKSEMAVGYCTLYGDMSGGFAVIKDVLKTQVYDLVTFRNERFGPAIPQSIFHRAPSAELRDDQKDQDSLPPYDVLDKMLKGYIEAHHSFAKMSRKNAPDLVKSVISMIDRSEYKRRQAPPGIKITSRAFGKDWRLPITNRYKEF